MIAKNKTYVTDILRSGADGEGVAEIDGMVVFVPGALVGERVEVLILAVKKSFAYGKVTRVITASPHRITPQCGISSKCGGCTLQHCAYDGQLTVKKDQIKSCFHKVGIEVDPEVVPSASPYGYRNKMSVPIGEGAKGVEIGFYAVNSHRIVPFYYCNVHTELINKSARACVDFFNREGFHAYNENTRRGTLKHLVIRELNLSLCVTVVCTDGKLKRSEELYETLRALTDKEVSIYVNKNDRDSSVILGKDFVRLQGNTPKGEMSGVNFELHPNSFFQVNPLAEKIYADVCGLMPDGVVIVDAFSGIGITSNLFCSKAKHVFGVEIVPEATANADALKEQNGNGDKITNICGDCQREIPALINRLKGEQIAVFLDPPRKGADGQTLSAVCSAEPQRIIYLSCNPATLARDVKFVRDKGYGIEYIKGYDLFPCTGHCEVLCVLQKTSQRN